MVLFDHKSNQFLKPKLDSNDSSNITNSFFTTAVKDSVGNIWIGTTTGIIKIDGSTQVTTRFGIRNGLNDDAIAGLLFDNSGQLWVSTAKGISVLNSKTNHFHNYELESYNRRAAFKDSNGHFYFGSLNGVTHFTPENIITNRNVPPIVLTSFKLFNQELTTDQPLSKLKQLTLDHQDNFFSFEFSALDYSKPKKNQYQYKLEGFDKNWIQVRSDRRFASYTNLNAGNYVFRVTGSNNDNVWNENGLSIQLTINPLWWETWWFYSMVGSILVAIILLVVFYIIKLNTEIHFRKQAENVSIASLKEKQTLIDEIHHRVKNNMTVISSLLKLQANNIEDD